MSDISISNIHVEKVIKNLHQKPSLSQSSDSEEEQYEKDWQYKKTKCHYKKNCGGLGNARDPGMKYHNITRNCPLRLKKNKSVSDTEESYFKKDTEIRTVLSDSCLNELTGLCILLILIAL